jgi:hypothetical protein
MALPFKLPSSGLYYRQIVPGHDGGIVMSPLRGEHEEVLSGLSESPQVRLMALRHITQQCWDLRGVPFPEMLVEDWHAAILQFLAYTAGEDTIRLKARHDTSYCDKLNVFSLKLSQVPNIELRETGPGESPNWPETTVPDPDIEAMKKLYGGERGTKVHVLAPDQVREPFLTALPNGQRVAWRHLRMRDLVAAEEYASAVQQEGGPLGPLSFVTPGAKMNTFLTAATLVSVDGRSVGPLEALTWVKRTASKVLDVFRAAIVARGFGYETSPRFRCSCGESMKVRLPLDGTLFRGDGSP